MKAIASFLGSSKKRKGANGATVPDDRRDDRMSVMSDQHSILSYFPAPPPPHSSKPSREQTASPEKQWLHPPPTPEKSSKFRVRPSMNPSIADMQSESELSSASSGMRQQRSTSRVVSTPFLSHSQTQHRERQGHHPTDQFESPRSPPTPPTPAKGSTPSSEAQATLLLSSPPPTSSIGGKPTLPAPPATPRSRRTFLFSSSTPAREVPNGRVAGETEYVLPMVSVVPDAQTQQRRQLHDLPIQDERVVENDRAGMLSPQTPRDEDPSFDYPKDGTKSAPGTPRRSLARRAFKAMMHSSTNTPPTQSSTDILADLPSPVYLSRNATPASSSLSLSSGPRLRKKSSMTSISYRAGIPDLDSGSAGGPSASAVVLPMAIPFAEEVLGQNRPRGGSVSKSSITGMRIGSSNALTLTPPVLEVPGSSNTFGSDWDFDALGPDPFRANSPQPPLGLSSPASGSLGPATPPSTAPKSAFDFDEDSPVQPAPASSEMQQQASSSRIGSKFHSLLHSRSARTLNDSTHGPGRVLPSATSHLASSVSAIPPGSHTPSPSISRHPSDSKRTKALDLSDTASISSSSGFFARRRAKSFTSPSPAPSHASTPEPLPPLPPSLASSAASSPITGNFPFARPQLPRTLSSASNNSQAMLTRRTRLHEVITEDPTAPMSLNDLAPAPSAPSSSASSRERLRSESESEIKSPALSTTSSLTARGIPSPSTYSLSFGQSPTATPNTAFFSIGSGGEPSAPSTPMSHVTGFSAAPSTPGPVESRSRSNSAVSLTPGGPESRRSVRPGALYASGGAGAGSSAASVRAMNSKRSMPELEGVWKGFLEEVEEDAVADAKGSELMDSAVRSPAISEFGGSKSRSASPTKSISGRSVVSVGSGRRSRRATTSSNVPSAGFEAKALPPVPSLAASTGGMRRPHVPPRLSLAAATALGVEIASATPSPAATPSTATSLSSSRQMEPSPPDSSSPLTPPFTPSADVARLAPTRSSRPISTATASSAHTVKCGEPASSHGRHPSNIPVPTRTRSGSIVHVSDVASIMKRQESSSSMASSIAPVPESEVDQMGYLLRRRLDMNGGAVRPTRSNSSDSSGPHVPAAQSVHSRTPSSLSLEPSLRSPSRTDSDASLNQAVAAAHAAMNTRSHSSLASVRRQHQSQDPNRTLSPRSSLTQLGSTAGSSNLTSNESASLLSWRSDLDFLQEGREYNVGIVGSTSGRSRASSRSTGLFGTEAMDAALAAKSGLSRPMGASPPASPSKMYSRLPPVPRAGPTFQLAPHQHLLQAKHSRESSISSLSSASSSHVSASGSAKHVISSSQSALRPQPPLRVAMPSTMSGETAVESPLTPPSSASPTKRMQFPTTVPSTPSTPSRRRSKAPSLASASSPHLSSSRQQDAELMRAVRAMEAEAELNFFGESGSGKRTTMTSLPRDAESHASKARRHQSSIPRSTPDALRIMKQQPATRIEKVKGAASPTGLVRPELHARSRSHDVLAASGPVVPPFLRDRSSSHPNIGEDVGYAV